MSKQEPVYLHLNADFPERIVELVGKNQIRMVYWDLGGTLVDVSRKMKARVVKKINMHYELNISVEMYDHAIRAEWACRETSQARKKIKAVNDESKERQYWIDFCACVLKNLGICIQDGETVKWLAAEQSNPASFEELPFATDTLIRLRGKNVQNGIISNAFPSIRKLLEKSSFLQEFNEQHIVLSYEYNCVKPERAIYRKAIDKARLRAQEILFIDDRESFVEGATKHGMKAVIINRTKD